MIKKPMLDAVVAVFNAHPELVAGLSHVNIDEHAIAFGIQEGLDAIVVHLIGLHGAAVVLVGTPSRDARRRLAVLCEHIGRAWSSEWWRMGRGRRGRGLRDPAIVRCCARNVRASGEEGGGWCPEPTRFV